MSVAEPATLERLSFRAFPAAIERDLRGWKLRATPDSASRRVNSATTPLGPVTDIGADIEAIEAFYGQTGADSIVRVLSPSSESIDRVLAARGYEDEAETYVMTTALVDEHASIEVTAGPTAQWAELKRRWTSQSAASIAAWTKRAHLMPGRLGCATHWEQGRPVSIGVGVVDDGWLGVFDVNTDPAVRRRGHATALMRGLHTWARRANADFAYLQVESGNASALALYGALGYERSYRYWYRRLSAAGTTG